MNIKISGQKTESNYKNIGSCIGAVTYCEHELRERPELYKELYVKREELSWFDMDGNNVKREEVIDKINRLKFHLGKNDTRFFCVMINPSDEEAVAMGATVREQLLNGRPYVFDVMDMYAANFLRQNIKNRHDLMAFAIPHIYKSDGKCQIHWHVLVARLSRGIKEETGDGKYRTKYYKLSPLTNHSNGKDKKTGAEKKTGFVKGGFSLVDFDGKCEQCFDKRFKYNRKVEQSFEYLLAEKKGTAEEKRIQEARLAEQNFPALAASIKNAFARRKERHAKEAFGRAEINRMIIEEDARLEAEKTEKANKNKFWNTYITYYKPLVDGLQKNIEDTLAMRDTLYRQRGECSKDISDRYEQIRQINTRIKQAKNDIKNASTSKVQLNLMAGLVVMVNPVAGLILALVGRIIIEVDRQVAYETRQALYKKAEKICKEIEALKSRQEQLLIDDVEIKNTLIEDRAIQERLFNEINILKKQLTKPIVPSGAETIDSAETNARLQKVEPEFVTEPEPPLVSQKAKTTPEIKEKYSDGAYQFRIIQNADGLYRLQQYIQKKSAATGQVIEQRWKDKAKFKSYRIISNERNNLYLEIQDTGGKTRFINQYGAELGAKQLNKLGLPSK